MYINLWADDYDMFQLHTELDMEHGMIKNILETNLPYDANH